MVLLNRFNVEAVLTSVHGIGGKKEGCSLVIPVTLLSLVLCVASISRVHVL